MPHCNRSRQRRQIESLRAQFAQADAPAFADVLSEERLETALREEGATWREQVFTPVFTLWAFLTQVLSHDGSCRAAVARVLAWLAAQGRPAASAKTDPYCKARQRLPESLFSRLTRETGQTLQEQLPDEWLWHGRRVKIADGTTVSMPDTPENQEAYPQSSGQQPGLGFPLARVVVVFSLACGAVLDAAIGRYQGKKTGENTLLRELIDTLVAGDVLLADRYYAGYFDLALWHARGVGVVVRKHQLRRTDFRTGRRLGHDDHIVLWDKPVRPKWLDQATYDDLPGWLILRETRVRVRQPGFRTKTLVVVTTLLDLTITATDLAELYRARWHAELDLRALKVTLGMDVLRCKSPAMIRKELWAHLLAYNLIRTVMAQAAQANDLRPRDLSFTGAVQTLTAFASLLGNADAPERQDLYGRLLAAVASHRVGDRPDRCEPRARKRKPKHYPFLKTPRDKARKARAARS
jgi:hypothetical protein